MVLPLLAVSCDDDNDFPKAVFDIQTSGGVDDGDFIYVQNGDTINIQSISIVADKSTKGAMILRTNYYWDNLPAGPGFAPTFGREFVMVNQPLGNHILTIEMLVGAEGYSVGYYVMNVPVKVVGDDFDMDSITPSGNSLFKTLPVKEVTSSL